MAAPKKTRRREETAPEKTIIHPHEEGDPRIARLRELVAILEGSSLAELSYEDQDIAVSLHRTGSASGDSRPVTHLTVPHAAPPPVAHAAPPPSAEPAEDPNVVVVRSPFVGTFYRSPKPDSPPFTEVGERVKRGQTVCIIEAMKLMNEIESDHDGTVVAIPAENGKPVQYGDPLFKIKKS
jgi:acetyl-CoA carboxylase biotin carboxyl carrier protein